MHMTVTMIPLAYTSCSTPMAGVNSYGKSITVMSSADKRALPKEAICKVPQVSAPPPLTIEVRHLPIVSSLI